MEIPSVSCRSILLLLVISAAGLAKEQDINYDEEYEYDGLPETGPSDGLPQEEDRPARNEDDFPVFEQYSRDFTVKEGESVEMSCRTTKPTRHVLIFKKEGSQETIIYVGTMQVSKAQKVENLEGLFKFTNVSRLDTGTYACHYQSSPISEIKYKLSVQHSPKIFTKSRKAQRVRKGEDVSLKCQARGNPAPVITWYKEKGSFPSGKKTEEGYSITLENVDRHVEGSFTCTASNGIGDPDSATFSVVVFYPPEILTEKAVVRTGEGDRVELVCVVHAHPASTVTWNKDGRPLRDERNIKESHKGHRFSITIYNVTETNFGGYQCNAQNEEGVTHMTINLTDLPDKPNFTSPTTSAIESSYTLAWDVESYYPVTEYDIKYRPIVEHSRMKHVGHSNETADEGWTRKVVEVKANEFETDGLVYHMKHTFHNLLPITDYEAIVSVKNAYKWGAEGTFMFSTRKEIVGRQKISGAACSLPSITLFIAAFFILLRS